MFVRYVERLKKMGAYIICLVKKPLIPLLSNHPHIDELRTIDETFLPYDAKASLMSLPAIFNDTEKTMPRNIPYLYPDEKLIAYWGKQLASDTNIKIGLCWQADIHNDVSRMPIARRGMPLSCWYPLLKAQGVSVYSLQCFDGTEQLKNVPNECSIRVFEDMDTAHGSFMDTAAIIQHLDLIISVDTAVAHLAGALGKPVCLLLPYAVDWRWIYRRNDSPWYPRMRIFKQPKAFDWDSVVQNVHQHLCKGYNLTIT